MTIREITDRATWESFVLGQQTCTFLHSWEWGEVQRATGESVQRLGVFEDEQLVAVALVILVKAKRGYHYLIPHGPISAPGAEMGEVLSVLRSYLDTRSQKDKAVALKIAPLLEAGPEHEQLFKQGKFMPSPLHSHAELTWVLDITTPLDQLLDGMRKTTRHAIKKAEAAGVTTEIITDASALERFWPLYEQTKQRHGFVPWSRETIAGQLCIFGEHDRIFTVIARYRREDVAAAICPVYGGTTFYYHGASKKLPSSVPAAQLLQWAAIQEAKRRGCNHYNFWGIAPSSVKATDGKPDPKHPFAGITTFKKGFGGRAVNYLHAQEIPLSLWYMKLWLVDVWRKYRRGF